MKLNQKKKGKKNKNSLLFIFILLIISFLPYINLLNADFVNWDDEIYVTKNSRVIKGLTFDNIKWAFSTIFFGFYYPITWISHMLDVSIFGLNAKGHHFTSILIHIFNSILLYFFLLQLEIEKIKSFIISCIFAVHPLNVESVGWISERKNLLAAFFFFLGLNLYLKYLKNPTTKTFVALFVVYLCGLMSKSVNVTFPVALYLIDLWPLKRTILSFNYIKENFSRLVKEKILFFIPIPLFFSLTLLAQKEVNALSTFELYPLDQRIAGAILAYSRYIYQFLFPFKLTAFYPHLRNNYSTSVLLFSIFFLLSAFVFSVKIFREKPFYFVGFSWFLINLLPVIGLIQVGEQGSADRYMYIPMIGLLWIFVLGSTDLITKIKNFKIKYAYIIFSSIIIIFSIKTHYQCKVWTNSDTLFQNMVSNSPNPSQGYINIGLEYKKKKEYLKAVEYYKKAIQCDPLKASAYNNLGSAYFELKDIEEAHNAFEKAVELNPNHSVMVYNLALSEELLGNIYTAKELYTKALKLKKSAPDPRKKLIKIYEKENDYLKALELSKEGEKVVEYDPEFARESVQILLLLKRYDEAKKSTMERLKRFPDDPFLVALYARSALFLGELSEAERYFIKAISLNKNDIDSIINLVDIKIKQNKTKEAFEILEKGIKENPNNPFLVSKYQLMKKDLNK